MCELQLVPLRPFQQPLVPDSEAKSANHTKQGDDELFLLHNFQPYLFPVFRKSSSSAVILPVANSEDTSDQSHLHKDRSPSSLITECRAQPVCPNGMGLVFKKPREMETNPTERHMSCVIRSVFLGSVTCLFLFYSILTLSHKHFGEPSRPDSQGAGHLL